MTESNLLVLDRGMGKTRALIASVLADDRPYGVIVAPYTNYLDCIVHELTKHGGRPDRHKGDVHLGDRRLALCTPANLYLRRGEGGGPGTPLWVDEVQMLPEGIYEPAFRTYELVLATATPIVVYPHRPWREAVVVGTRGLAAAWAKSKLGNYELGSSA